MKLSVPTKFVAGVYVNDPLALGLSEPCAGSATSIANRLKTNGPNFNIRKENAEQVIYAIRNGGFSGAIMPQNIVVGQNAQAVAEVLAQYSGRQAQKVPSTPITLTEK